MIRVQAALQGTGPAGGPPFIAPVCPRAERQVEAEDERYRTVINEAGVTLRELKEHPEQMPNWIDYPVKSREDWRDFKKLLDPHHPERWPVADWEEYVKKMKDWNFPLGYEIGSLYGIPREFVGAESWIYMFYDDPTLVEEIMDHMAYFGMEIIKKVCSEIEIDFAVIFEDIAYNQGPLISPKMFKEFMVPRYRKMTDLLRKCGVDVIFVDSDGDISELIPLWLEAGVNGIYPLECAAGMDAVKLRKEHGKDLLLWGNVDKMALAKGKEAIRAELNYKIPFLIKDGGYLPGIDHFIPPDVSLENFLFYLEYIRGFMEK